MAVKDIRKAGPQSYRDLQKANAEALYAIPDNNPFVNLKPSRSYSSQLSNVYEGYEMSPLQQQGNGDYWGRSKYDNPTATEEEYQNLNEVRYENQPWYDVLANGFGKMYGTAGTTFLSSIIGIPFGIEEAIRQGRWSAIWDNSVTQALSNVDDWMEENLTNYKSQKQQESPWYDPSNLFSMNFIADDIIKNNGFMIGSVASMAVGSGEIGLISKALGFVGDVGKGAKIAKTTQNVLSSLFAATGEGMIEAKQGVNERNKLELEKLNNALAPEENAINMEEDQIDQEYAATKGMYAVYDRATGRMVDPAYDTYMQKKADVAEKRNALAQKRKAAEAQIEESGQEMGNTILLANQGLLTMGNLLQFSKGMTKSFDIARRAAQTSSKFAKPALTTATRAGKTLSEGYKVSSKWPGRIYSATKGIITEGSEEMNQQWIQASAGAAYNNEDVNDYWKARLNSDAYNETTKGLYTFGTILDRGFRESWGDPNQWEQFVIGGITGGMGSYMPTKLFNQDKSKAWYNPMRYGEWQGGALNEIKDFNRQYSQLSENIDDVNKVLAQNDFADRIQRLTAHTYHETNKTKAAEDDDKKLWKDEDDKQTIHDIQSFLRAGKIDDLRAIYKQIGSEWSDEDINGLFAATTHHVTADEDAEKFKSAKNMEIGEKRQKIDSLTEALDMMEDQNSEEGKRIARDILKEEKDVAALERERDNYVGKEHYIGAFVDEEGNHTKTNDEIREIMKHNAESLDAKIDSYLESVEAVNKDTNGMLTKDQEDNLAYLHNLGKEDVKRSVDIISEHRKNMPKKVLLRTDSTPEQLAKRYSLSEALFTQDSSTPKGYVEADLSMMDDKEFTNFFIREVLWGGSVRQEFGETADEKALREKEEKTLPKAERQKRAKERRMNNIKATIEKGAKDAADQYYANINRMQTEFITNYKKNNDASEAEAQTAFLSFLDDVFDASKLQRAAGIYRKTLNEYMENPGKVEEDKAKEGKKIAKAEKDKQAKDKFAGKSVQEIKQDVNDGAVDYSDLDAALKGMQDGSISADDSTKENVKNAKGVIDKKNSLKGHLSAVEDGTVAADADQMVDWLAAQATNPDEIDPSELDNFDAGLLLSDDEVEYMQGRGYTDAQIAEQAEARKQRAMSAINGSMEAWQKDREKGNIVPSAEDQTGNIFGQPDDTGHDGTAKSPSNQGNETLPAEPKEIPIIITPDIATSDKTREEVTEEAPYEGSDNGGTWRNTTRRIGRDRGKNGRYGNTDVPYHEIAKRKYGENSFRYKRSKAIYDYLNSDEIKAFDHVENAGDDRIQPNAKVRFKIKSLAKEIFDKELSELSPEDQKRSMVILMVDERNNVIGDLPLPELEPDTQKDDVKLLQGLYDKTTEKLLAQYSKDGTTEAFVDGKDGLGMTFKSGAPLTGEIFEVKKGYAPYTANGDTRTLNEIAGTIGNGNVAPFTLAIKILDGQINVGSKKQAETVARGIPGQPYILIPDASGKPIAVPFTTPLFNAEEMQNTNLYKLLTEALTQFEKYPKEGEHKEDKNKAIVALCSLLQIENPFINLDNKDKVILTYSPLGNKEERITVEVSKGDNWKQQLLNKLDGTKIQVSLQKINGDIGVGKYSIPYNEVIGEIAYTNLPENTTHSFGTWFTIKPLSDKKERGQRVTYPSGTTVTKTLSNGRTVIITTGNTWTATDPRTGDLIEGDEVVDLEMAQMQADNNNKTSGNIKVDINGDLRTYNIDKKAFVKEAPAKPKATKPSNDKVYKDIIAYLELHPSGKMEDLWKAVGIDDSDPFSGVHQLTTRLTKEEGLKLIGKLGDRYEMPKEWVNKKAAEAAGISIAPEDNKSYKEREDDTPEVVAMADNFDDIDREAKADYLEQGLLKQGLRLKEIAPRKDAYYKALTNDLQNAGKPGYVSEVQSKYHAEDQLARQMFEEAKKQMASPKPEGNKKFNTIEEAEKAATALKLLDKRKTQYAWNALSEDARIALMNGNDIQMTLNWQSRTLSINAVQETIKTLQEWNSIAKSNPSSIESKVLYRKVDAEAKKADIRKERRWLQKNLPMFNASDRLILISNLLEIPGEEGWAWGRFQKGVITLSEQAAKGTLYHEAFHAVTQTLLSDEELNELYDAATKYYKETDVALVEELLAEDFRKYVQQEETPVMGTIRRVFRKIMNAIKNFMGYRDPIQQLFYRINNGEFKESIPRATRSGNAFYSIANKYYLDRKDPQVEYIIKDGISRGLKRGSKEDIIGRWDRYIKHWIGKGFRPVGHWEASSHMYKIDGVMTVDGYNRWSDEVINETIDAYEKEKREKYQAQQAFQGRERALRWENLAPEIAEALIQEGKLTQESWEKLSLEEKEQYVQCY